MLILTGISLSGLIGEKGLFQKTEKASNRYNEAKARETLETVLLTDGQYDKNINPEYNQNEYLNELIKREIPGSKVIEDVAIVDGYGYELDRSVPKIGRYVGKENDLIWPTVDAIVKLADDKKDATITITASEEKQGINKIEIWLLGEKIKEYTYDPAKPEATENYIATQNGEYTIKAYGYLMASKTVEVNGIVASVKFDPNGDETWKKSHSTTVTIQETTDKVVNSKYYWSNSVTTPDDSKFPEDQTFKSGDTITKNGDTGTYYLWTRLQTQSGEILKWRSEGFNFDNQGPNITALTYTAINDASFKLNVTAQDTQSGIVKYEFFVGGSSKGTKTVNEVKTSNSQELTITNVAYGGNSCYVIVKDKLGNTTRKDITAKTLKDTTGPTITEFMPTKYSETGITLKATAHDTGSGIVKFEFYIDGTLKSEYTQTIEATRTSTSKTVNITGLSTGEHTCMVKVYDAENNSSTSSKEGTTKLYAWNKYDTETTKEYTYSYGNSSWQNPKTVSSSADNVTPFLTYTSVSIDKTSGKFTAYGGANRYANNGSESVVGMYSLDSYAYKAYGISSPRRDLNDVWEICDVKVEMLTTVDSYGSWVTGYGNKLLVRKLIPHQTDVTVKGKLISTDVTSTLQDAYPLDGIHSDGFYYVRRESV